MIGNQVEFAQNQAEEADRRAENATGTNPQTAEGSRRVGRCAYHPEDCRPAVEPKRG